MDNKGDGGKESADKIEEVAQAIDDLKEATEKQGDQSRKRERKLPTPKSETDTSRLKESIFRRETGLDIESGGSSTEIAKQIGVQIVDSIYNALQSKVQEIQEGVKGDVGELAQRYARVQGDFDEDQIRQLASDATEMRENEFRAKQFVERELHRGGVVNRGIQEVTGVNIGQVGVSAKQWIEDKGYALGLDSYKQQAFRDVEERRHSKFNEMNEEIHRNNKENGTGY